MEVANRNLLQDLEAERRHSLSNEKEITKLHEIIKGKECQQNPHNSATARYTSRKLPLMFAQFFNYHAKVCAVP